MNRFISEDLPQTILTRYFGHTLYVLTMLFQMRGNTCKKIYAFLNILTGTVIVLYPTDFI